MDVKEILSAWTAALNPTEEQKEIADSRMSICKDCEEFKDFGIVSYCHKCGCPSKGKVFSPHVNGCPLLKWVK